LLFAGSLAILKACQRSLFKESQSSAGQTGVLTAPLLQEGCDQFTIFIYSPFSGGKEMRLSAPTQGIWLVAMILGVLGIVARFVVINYVTAYSFWFVAFAFILLAIGTTYRRI
jgi:hypothetical protein